MHVAIRRLHETSGRQFVGTRENLIRKIIQIRKSAKPPAETNRERHHGSRVNFEHVNFEQRYLRLSFTF